MVKIPDLPLTSPGCKKRRFWGDRHECTLGGRCEPAYADIPDLSTCTRDHEGKLAFERANRKGQSAQTISLPVVAVKQPCINLGEATGQTMRCPSCRGEVNLKTFACAKFDVCTMGESGNPIAGCKGCQQFTTDAPLEPERIIKVNMPSVIRADGHGSHYNCSIIEWQRKTLMASRLGWVGSSIWLCELDEDFQPIPGTLRDLNLRHPKAYSGAEDPRFFVFAGQLHIAFSGYFEDKEHTTVFIAGLDDQLRCAGVLCPKYAWRKTWEKSWSCYEHAGSLHCVYSISPHVVLRIDGEVATEVSRTTHDFGWANTTLRGGASPVRVGGEFYSWAHTFSTDKRGMTTWQAGLYTFAASSPFQLLRRISHTLLFSDESPKMSNKNIAAYPCGAMLRDEKWHISYGFQDHECRIAVFDAGEVEKRLR